MNYELAKKLKEAGFPQFPIAGSGMFIDGKVEYSNDGEWQGNIEPPLKVPSLSELIEACGDRFGGLEKQQKDWFCYSIQSRYLQIKSSPVAIGYTPEEAVVYLWLTLNKKS